MSRSIIHIRPAIEGDIDDIMFIEMQDSARWKRSYFENEFENSFSSVIVAESENQVVGFAVAWNVTNEIQLNNIGVHKLFRHRGIGTQLIDYIVDMERLDIPEKLLLEVKEKNTAAQHFYLHLGFRIIGKRPNYYGDDNAILMEKDLS